MADDSQSSSTPPHPSDNRPKLSFLPPFCYNLSCLWEKQAYRNLIERFCKVSEKLKKSTRCTAHCTGTADIVWQGRVMCEQYMRCRLKRSRIIILCKLKKLRYSYNLPGGDIVREAFPKLNNIGQELERKYPRLYISVGKQVSGKPVLVNENMIIKTLMCVGQELKRSDLTWAKVVSLYAVAGGLAIDCVRQDNPEYLPVIAECMAMVIHEHLADWIASKGGWLGLILYCNPDDNDITTAEYRAIVAAVFSIFLFVSFVLRWFIIRIFY